MTFLKKIRGNRRIYFLWLSSYLCIFLIPIIASSIFYVTSLSTFEKEMIQTNFTMLNQMKQVIDNKLSETQSISQQISFDPNVQRIMQSNQLAEEIERNEIFQALRNFSIYRASSNSFRNFYVLFHKIDLCLSSGGEYTKDLLYQSEVGNKSISEDAWVTITNNQNKSGFYVLSSTKINSRYQSNFAYIQTLPILEMDEPLATVVVEVDTNELYTMVDNIASTNKSIVYMLDKDNHILTSTTDADIIHNIKFDDLPEDSNLIYHLENGQEMAVSYIQSDVSNWKYVIITPKNVFGEKVNYLKNISYVCYLFSFIVGIFMTFFLLKRNYKPVRELMRTLSNTETSASSKDEFRFISDVVSKTITEKNTINDKLEKQNASLKYSFLSTLIRGRVSGKISIEKAFEAYQIEPISDYYSVILFCIEDFSGFVDNEEMMGSPSESMDLIQFVVRNVVEELAAQKHVGYVAEVDNMLCCLVNLNPDYIHEAQNDLYHIANETLDVFKNNLHIYLTASFSEILTGFTGIPTAYKQALEAMEYRMITGGNKILPYSHIQDSNQNNFYEYDLEMENQLINSVKTGNYENADRILNDVFNRNFLIESPSVQMAKFLMFELMSTIMKAMREINIVYDNYFLDDMNNIESLMHSNNVLEIKSEILATVKKVCSYIQNNKKSHNEQLKDDILDIIERNYKNINLNLQYIAEELGISTNYLSKFFKEQMGIGFVDYLHMLRIKKSKEMLKEDQRSIAEIAEAIGYSNSNTFIRAFKKSEGITPGQYRDSSLLDK